MKWHVCWLFVFLSTAEGFAQGTAFTYQGLLNDGTNRANGLYDLQFALYDAAGNGNQQGNFITNSATAVSNGFFTVTLDFGNQFPGAERWLEISVRTNNASTFGTLNPRQPLTAAPYAVHAATADTFPPTNSQTQIFTGTNIFQGPLNFTNSANMFVGQFFGNGAGLTNVSPFTSILTTNSTMAQIKAALAQGGSIWFQPGDYRSVDNLELTNNTVIFGSNAVLHAKPGLTNFLIDEDLSTVNISIYGLSVTGDSTVGYTSTRLLSLYPPSPYYQSNLVNQGGMRLNMATGGSTVGCSAYGFGGYGFMLVSPNGSAASDKLNSFFYGNHAYNNFVGVGLPSWPWEYPQIFNVSLQAWTNYIQDEHQVVSGNEMFLNGIGLYAPAGNCVIEGNKITSNNYGIVLSSGYNSDHGEVIGNTLNHNNIGIVASTMLGEIIRDNMLLDVNSIYIDDVQYLVFEGNQLSGSGPGLTLTVTNYPWSQPDYVTLSHNYYLGSWGTDIIVTTNLAGPGATYVYGNRSLTVSNDTDGSTVSLSEIGAAATTNYTLPSGPTFYITNGVIWKLQ